MDFKNTIIISYYDSGVNKTIWLDGEEVYSKEREWIYEEMHPLQQYVEAYVEPNLNDMYKKVKTRVKELKALAHKYRRSVLFCEDGNIEYYPYLSNGKVDV